MSHFFSPPGGQNKNVIPRAPTSTEKAAGLLPGAKADAAARAGGGISPEFLNNVLGQQVGDSNIDLLAQIRQSLGQ
jgi:hypothetical protein